MLGSPPDLLAVAPSAVGGERALYRWACDPEAAPAPPELVRRLVDAVRTGAGAGAHPRGTDDAAEAAATHWAETENARLRELITGADEAVRPLLARRAALACAPLALRSGGWLQWLSAPADFEDPVTLTILALYASDIGVGHSGASRGSAFHDLLRRLRVADDAVPTLRLVRHDRVPDGAFVLPALLLAMSRRPADFGPEILGADLCLRVVGLLPGLAAVRAVLPDAGDWDLLDTSAIRPDQDVSGLAGARRAVDGMVAAGGPDTAGRVATGFHWALAHLRRMTADLYDDLAAARDPAYPMLELLRRRAREGAVYHHDVQLDRRPLQEWLADSRTDPAPLLAALARSRLVRPAQADRSLLVTSLLGPRGPMFRIFDSEEVGVIRRWIDSLPDGGPAPVAAALPAPVPDTGPLTVAMAAPVPDGREPADLREAYHLLLHRAVTPACRRWARLYVDNRLEQAAAAVAAAAGLEAQLPASWDPSGLRPWLLEQHDRHGRDFDDRSGPLPSREALIDQTVQLAPLTLIDGAWLQGFTDHELADTAIGHGLFETYWDELGNGVPALNHPRIYREVLAEMGMVPPPTRSPEFARWPSFADASFERPVHWLSIGRFPRTYLPEILGLNLAMELSGVGGGYRTAHVALRAYGFTTRFVDIHNTIDNVASGHSAWAADAVDSYLVTLPDAPGPDGRDAAWQRVRVGYRALDLPPPPARPRRATAAVRTWRERRHG